jgi:glycosyltransferase involved in cell wall biosynthesis
MESNLRVLFVYSILPSFVKNDLSILKKHFCVTPLKVATWSVPRKGTDIGDFWCLFREILHSDVVYMWWADINAFFSILFCKVLRKKCVIVVGGSEVAYLPELNVGGLVNPFNRIKVKLILSYAWKVFVVSQSSFNELRRLVKLNNVKTIHNGVNTDWFKPKGAKERIVLTVGSAKRKRLDVFVKVAQELPDERFIIIGNYDTGVKNVTIIPYVSDEELLSLYQRTKVYVQLSAHEGFGVALAEAMSCGCIPVVSNRYAMPEVVGDSGSVVEYEDVDRTVKAIERSFEVTTAKPRERIVNFFSLKNRESILVQELVSNK